MAQSVLIIDDDRTARRAAAGILGNRLGLDALEGEDGAQGLKILAEAGARIRLVLLDLDMPVMGGMEALEKISRHHPGIPVIVLTGTTDMNNAVRAMKAGAVDFLCKPVEAQRLEVSARNALKISLMSREMAKPRRGVAEGALVFSDLIGHEAGLTGLVATGRRAAACDLPVLITGETGTGKEVFARAIHGESKRAEGSFIAVNCGAIPEKLVESTLFGHEKGAFTGAIAKAPGKFQEANGGTIFLDEIGELPLEAQVKLLRVLQQKEVEPVGAARSVAVDVRVISATNRDLAREVRDGRFREDLYFRLNVMHIDVPPLRARIHDIPDLARHFVDMFCASHNAEPKTVTADSLAKLQTYGWPGNVRELENVINRTMAMCDKERLEPAHFSFLSPSVPLMPQNGNAISLIDGSAFKTMAVLEEEIITSAIKYHNGNMTQAARALGIAKSTLYTKLGKRLSAG